MKPVDEDSNRELLKAAVAEHKENAIVGDNMKSVVYRDDTIGKTTYQMKDISPFGMADKIQSSAVPMIIWSGWLDAATTDGTLSRFLTFSNKQQIVIGPYSHGGGFDTNPFLEANTPVTPSSEGQLLKKIESLDKLLKDEDTYSINNFIRYFTMGENVWRETSVWPPEYVENVTFYFNKDGILSQHKPLEIEGSDLYEVDYTATTGMQNRWFTNMGGGDVIYPNRKEEDKKLLSYTTPVLDSDIEITGSIIVKLQVSSTHSDGAFFAYLEDVAPDGKVTYVTEGMLRAVHRKISEDPAPYVMLGPNHSFKKNDAMPLVPGEVSEIEFKLFATSVQIKKGHCIRIALAGADDSIFSRFPKEGTPVWQIQRNTSHISSVTFPIRK
jgi:putative CocE/NonD family hydrolase